MDRLTNKDYRDILNLVELANRCEAMGSFIDTLIPSVMRVFHSECATFQLVKGYPCHTEIIESRSFRTDDRNLYEDKHYPVLYKDAFYHDSPLLKEAISSSQTVLKIGDAISYEKWARSDFYNNFIRPQHLFRELFMTLRWKNKLEGMITLWRPEEQTDYEDRDISKAEMLTPYLMIAINNMRLVSQINAWKNLSLSGDDADSEGLLWLDNKFTPSLYNTKAKNICMQLFDGTPYNTHDPEKGDFPIPSYVVKDCSELLDLLKVEKLPILTPKERIILTESGRKFRIECSLIFKVDQINSMPNFMVTLSDLTEKKKIKTDLQTKFRLSRREMDVIYYLTMGLSDSEIAAELYISKLTVHTHIKNIYSKLGARSRIELYRRVVQGELSGDIQPPI